MKIPLWVAIALQQILKGAELPHSKLRHSVIVQFVQDDIIRERLVGRTKKMYSIIDPAAFNAYLSNRFGIDDLDLYVETITAGIITRGDAVEIASNSKLKRIRTFKGFLVNCYEPVEALLNGNSLTINPNAGTFTFVYDYESFVPDERVIIVGIENPENFRWIERQNALFKNLQPLFVSRYPQNRDLIKWLTGIKNKYLHFGDFDFEGINIYLSEYKKFLGERANFFVPNAIDDMIKAKGNHDLYIKQFHLRPDETLLEEKAIKELLKSIYKHSKVLEQEYLIKTSLALPNHKVHFNEEAQKKY